MFNIDVKEYFSINVSRCDENNNAVSKSAKITSDKILREIS